MKRPFLLFAVLLFLLTSCVGAGKVKILDVGGVNMATPSKIEALFVVENSSAHNIQVKSGKFVIQSSGSDLMDMTLSEPIKIARRSTSEVTLPVRVKLSDPLMALAFAMGRGPDLNKLTVTGEAVVKAGWGRKKIKLDKVPLSKILSNFGVDPTEVFGKLKI